MGDMFGSLSFQQLLIAARLLLPDRPITKTIG